MKFIPTNVHAIIDYIMGILLIALPWLLDFARGGAETWVPVIVGAGVILYSLCTDYEYSMARLIGMRGHLALDAGGGLVLIVSPWLFGFADYVFWPHVIVGLLEVVAAFTTRTDPHGRRSHQPTHASH